MTGSLFDITEDTVGDDSFEALEAKINEVVDRLAALNAEKAELAKHVELWRSRYEEAARRIDELTTERDMLRGNQRDTQQEELIRSKIAALLTKLETA
jgi:FtsZ-binding cell division protein ZapB